MQLKAELLTAVEKLSQENVPSPRLNAELLMMFILSCSRAYLYAHPDRELTSGETARYQSVLKERILGVPAQYIVGHQEFWGMDFLVTPAVLIPRPETEHVVETVLACIEQNLSPARKIRIVDMGTGSGCIALALAKELPQAEIDATDTSAGALEIARANAARHQLESRIQFHQTNLLEGLPPDAFDFVVSNPPYVGDSEEEQVQLEVRKFEPRNAVFAGPDGTEIIASLIPQAQVCLKPGGWLVMEISGTIQARVREMLAGWGELQIINDLQGIARVVAARKTD